MPVRAASRYERQSPSELPVVGAEYVELRHMVTVIPYGKRPSRPQSCRSLGARWPGRGLAAPSLKIDRCSRRADSRAPARRMPYRLHTRSTGWSLSRRPVEWATKLLRRLDTTLYESR